MARWHVGWDVHDKIALPDNLWLESNSVATYVIEQPSLRPILLK